MAKERLQRDCMTLDERRAFGAHIETLWYQEDVIKTGLIEERMEGFAEGFAEGFVKGHAEGLAEGETKTLERIVVDGNRSGLSYEQLRLITKLTDKQIIEILKHQ